MMHVREIKNLFDDGDHSKATEALERLLEIGPQNLEALKLKALLLSSQGRFKEEAKIWEKIASIAPEDEDMVSYYQYNYLEDRDIVYFSDPLPGGGRRFLAHPRKIISISIIGLLGCMCFLTLSNLSKHYAMFTSNPYALLAAFLLLVFVPWIAIVFTYIFALREVLVTHFGLRLNFRFKSISLSWKEIEAIYVSHSHTPHMTLSLVIIPINKEQKFLDIDLFRQSSVIKPRRAFLSEIEGFFGPITFATRSELHLQEEKKLKI